MKLNEWTLQLNELFVSATLQIAAVGSILFRATYPQCRLWTRVTFHYCVENWGRKSNALEEGAEAKHKWRDDVTGF